MDKKQYYAIKNALTYTEKVVIDFYELCWFLRQGYVPTNQEVIDHVNTKYAKEGKHTRLKHTSLNYSLNRRTFIKALETRGINFRQHTQTELTPTQIAAAITVCNFADERTTKEKLDQMGLNETQYYAWLKDPQFQRVVEELADQNLKNIRPVAIVELTKKINAGDWQATKFYLETTGAVNNEAPQGDQYIKMLIEIIQEEVKDQETITRIAKRIQLASQNRRVEVIEGQSQVRPQEQFNFKGQADQSQEPDLELQYAKRQLGI